MTVKELRDWLADKPDNIPVMKFDYAEMCFKDALPSMDYMELHGEVWQDDKLVKKFSKIEVVSL